MSKKLENCLIFSFILIWILICSYSLFSNEWNISFYFLAVLLVIVLLFYPKLLYWILIISIPFSSEIFFNNLFYTDFPDEFLMLFITSITILILFINNKKFIQNIFQNKIIILLFFQFLWGLICVYHSQTPMYSLKYIVAKVWYIIPFIISTQFVLYNKNSFKLLGLCIILPSVLIILIVLFKHSFYSFSFLTINKCVQPFFRNHVTYAAWLSFPFSILIGILLNSKIKKKYLILLISLFSVAIIFTYTRGTWLSIFISIVVYFLFIHNYIKKVLIFCFIICCSVVTYLSVNNNYLILKPDYSKTIFHTNFSEHINSMYSMKEISGSERIFRWVAGAKMTTAHPIVGFGPNSFYSTYKQYIDNRFKTYVSNNIEKSTVHNYFLLTIVEQGILGLIFFLSLIYIYYSKCHQLYIKINDTFYKIIISILCIIMTNILVVDFFSDMIETDKVGTIYFLCFGILIWIEKNIESNTNLIIE